jgi:hypothetical protein
MCANPECEVDNGTGALCGRCRKRAWRGSSLAAPVRAFGQTPWQRVLEGSLAWWNSLGWGATAEERSRARARLRMALAAYAAAPEVGTGNDVPGRQEDGER